MKNSCSKIIQIWCVLWLLSCVVYRKKSKAIEEINKRTGESIVDDNSIQCYEMEHKKFYNEETKYGTLLKWPNMDNENLTNYCRKYLQYLVPTRTTDHATGAKMERTLGYMKTDLSNTSRIVTVCCTVLYKNHKNNYYITRALEPNCVYALKPIRNYLNSILAIIHKHCDIEHKKSDKLKWGEEYIGGIHKKLGQPIARPEYLQIYELEHQKLFIKEKKEGKFLMWPYAMTHSSLNSYCYQYMRKCAPGRMRIGVTGIWQPVNLHYQKLNTTDRIVVITVKCKPPNDIRQDYYMTRALETNCVYALLRKSSSPSAPLEIIFKHCDFEDRKNQQNITQNFNTFNRDVIPKVEVKEEVKEKVFHFLGV